MNSSSWAELPGISEDDVYLEVENNILTVRGEKRDAEN
jgi:HSP20 family molecular chaperone IbpA